MITCQHAKHLFDRYLDGELSPSLQAELHAHQLSCSDCQGELALLEACGDVIAYDRCEPMLSDSFTDRVLLASHGHVTPLAPRRRNWTRIIIRIGSPLAAAACIAMAVLFAAPGAKPVHHGKVLSLEEVSPIRQILNPGLQEQVGPNARELPGGFAITIAGPMVEQTKNAIDSTKRSLEQLDSLFRLSIAGANSALAAGARQESDRKPAVDAARSSGEPDLMDPFSPRPSANPDSTAPEIEDGVEAM